MCEFCNFLVGWEVVALLCFHLDVFYLDYKPICVLTAIEGLTRMAFSEEINSMFGQYKEKLYEIESLKYSKSCSSSFFSICLAGKHFLQGNF